MKKRKKYNQSTGGYKIDVFCNGGYMCSTDRYKTCKAAKDSIVKKYPKLDSNNIKAFFDYQ